jgi:hypothetical protein
MGGAHLDYLQFKMEKVNLSFPGRRQVMNGEPVTSPANRKAIAKILRAISNSPAAQMAIRREMLNNKYPET